MTVITVEKLKESGWKENTGEDRLFAYMEKVISNETMDPVEGLNPLVLEINNDHNRPQISLRLCEGGKLDLSVESMEELEAFEKSIAGYRPDW